MAYFKQGSLVEATTTIVTSGATTTLTASSNTNEVFTGTSTQTVQLPDATTLPIGRRFRISNRSSQPVTVNYNDGSQAKTISPDFQRDFVVINNGTTNGTWDISNGSTGTGSGGINYIANPDGEINTNFWSAFNTTFTGGLPTTITPGSTKLSIVRTTSNFLRGVASLQLNVTTAAASTGHGLITDAMTIDNADLAKVLTTGFEYFFATGATNVDVSGTSTQTIELWVYNVGLAIWYQPAGFRGINTKSVPGKVVSTFQTDSQSAANDNQYRFAIIIRNDPTGTFQMNFDTVTFGPQVQLFGPPVTDTVSYTPIFVSLGTISSVNASYSRRGDKLTVNFTVVTGTHTGTSATVSIPSGLTIDPAKIQANGIVGKLNSTVTPFSGSLVYFAGDTNILHFAQDAGNFEAGFAATNWANNSEFSGVFEVPIVGWSSNVQFSSDTDTRVLAVAATRSLGQGPITSGVWTKVQFDAVEYDTHAAYDKVTNFRFTAPISGYYKFVGAVNYSSTASTGEFAAALYLNGGKTREAAASKSGTAGIPFGTAFSFEEKMNAGDFAEIFTIQITGDNTISLRGDASDTGLTAVQISRVSGPSVVAANESVNARYYQNSPQSIAANSGPTIVNFDTKDFDSHAAVTTGASWKFTAPVTGKYHLSSVVTSGSDAWAGGNSLVTQIFKNGALYTGGMQITAVAQATGTFRLICVDVQDLSLIAGDFVDVRVIKNGGTTGALFDGGGVYVSIHKTA